ncbi:hypothetical protein K5X82_00570 [Halosquirtibacter xylanolyticus]|uniref:hypothetical protein n=1 Tax=Halosquirtibacter xylanolyticus TaxID=3374599 RepID=UPI003749D1AD|nr:hypothetical protein K5X82_00570 [Prolixibacteraceae bacterium]
MEEIQEELNINTFACTNCGADLKYKAGTDHLSCDYCGALNEIPKSESKIEEHDYLKFLANESEQKEVFDESFVKCESCGASSTISPNITSTLCPYCTTPLIVEQTRNERILLPESLLPFKLDKDAASDEFKKWINKLWFAPNALKKAALSFDHFKGVYIPYWTFDMDTHTPYIGQRGVHYYVTEEYTKTEDGKTVTETREVQKTRWSTVTGNIHSFFDDILTVATTSLPEKYINKLEPWDLENLVPFDKSYLSGYITEKYQIEITEGFKMAQETAESEIRDMIRTDIGGDEQRITSMETDYNDIAFKHLLLPVFVCAYRFKGELYQFLVNGRTGEVQGRRPYSWIKIALTVLAIVSIITAIIFVIRYYNG